MAIKTLNSAADTASANPVAVDYKLSDVQTSLNWNGLDSDWSPWSASDKCPKCNGNSIEVNNCICLTTYPVQSQLRCKDCGHYFSSGIFSTNDTSDATDDIWKHDQSILNGPKVGDWPPGPQVGDAPWWPCEQEPPAYPDIYITRKDSPVGWVCPKCNRCWAPHISGCSHCNSSEIKITY